MLAAYLEGEVTPSERQAVDEALAASAALRRQADGMRRVKQQLVAPLADLDGVDLVASVRAAIRQSEGAKVPARRHVPGGRWRDWRWRWPLGLGALGAVAAVALVLLALPARETGFRSRSAGMPTSDAARFTSFRAFRMREEGTQERLTGTMSARDGLLFDYVNLAPHPFANLMIFGVDGAGEVRWFFPAYEQRGTNPISIAITKGRATLNDVVHHDDLPRGRLTLHALFTSRPLHVLEVEAWVKRPRPGNALPWSAAYQVVIETSVE